MIPQKGRKRKKKASTNVCGLGSEGGVSGTDIRTTSNPPATSRITAHRIPRGTDVGKISAGTFSLIRILFPIIARLLIRILHCMFIFYCIQLRIKDNRNVFKSRPKMYQIVDWMWNQQQVFFLVTLPSWPRACLQPLSLWIRLGLTLKLPEPLLIRPRDLPVQVRYY